MGLFADFLAGALSVDINSPITALDLPIIREIKGLAAKFDPDLPAEYDGIDEVQSMTANGSSGGNFTLTVTLKNGESFTTGNIAYNADAATVEGAIDTAATAASITGWTNGDISVSGGSAEASPTVFTFDGDSVSAQNHPLITVDGAGLTGGAAGTVSAQTEGQTARLAWAVLEYSGVLYGPPPTQGTVGTITVQNTRESWPNMPSQDFIRTLAKEAAVEDGYALVEDAILDACGLQKTL